VSRSPRCRYPLPGDRPRRRNDLPVAFTPPPRGGEVFVEFCWSFLSFLEFFLESFWSLVLGLEIFWSFFGVWFRAWSFFGVVWEIFVVLKFV
jgi:hypothetical protein